MVKNGSTAFVEQRCAIVAQSQRFSQTVCSVFMVVASQIVLMLQQFSGGGEFQATILSSVFAHGGCVFNKAFMSTRLTILPCLSPAS
jgi:hypothetical protein